MNELVTKDFVDRITQFKREITKKYQDISRKKTPKKFIKKRPDGFDYVEESIMRDLLDKYFPLWSWEGHDVKFLGYAWIVVTGHLIIVDEGLLAFGINPPVRKFFGTGAARIQYKKEVIDKVLTEIEGRKVWKEVRRKGEVGNPNDVIDIDKNLKSANTQALKFAINRLCRIADDVYKKRSELGVTQEQAAILNEFIEKHKDNAIVMEFIERNIDNVTPDNFNLFMNKLKTLI
jgi:hypothetical protein